MSEDVTMTRAPRPEEKLNINKIRDSKGGRVGVKDMVQFRDSGPSVEEAKAAMLAAGEQPQGRSVQRDDVTVLGVNKQPSRPAGGNTPADGAPAVGAHITRAKLTLVNPDGTDGESDILTADTNVELRNAIINIHARAQRKGLKLRVEPLSATEIQTQEQQNEPEIIITDAPKVEAKPVIEDAPKLERRENAKFILEIRQENGEWVGEINYKNGAGVERFSAPTRKELDMKILEGKAHATVRIREFSRREKYGVELDKVYTLPEYLTQAAYDALPAEAQQAMIDNIASQACLQFLQAHPEYYKTDENWDKIKAWLNHRKLPFTFRNLEYTFQELSDEGELEFRPEPQVSVPSESAKPTQTVDSVVAAPVVPAPAAQTPAAPVVQVRKRGSTGLKPGDASAIDTALDASEGTDNKPKELSVAELRKLPMDQLRTLVRQDLAKKPRQF